MRRLRSALGRLVLAAWLFGATVAVAKSRTSPDWEAMNRIVQSSAMTPAEKVAALLVFVERPERPMSLSTALHFMHQVDAAAAEQLARERFQASASRAEKLELGRLLLARWHVDGFAAAYGQFLAAAVVDGGAREFCTARDGTTPAAVGEYAHLAAGFEGYRAADFVPALDPRVIPVLIACLEAPDTVWPVDQGDCLRGQPGTATGRNTERQNLPLALARLGATAATPALLAKLRQHQDYYLRFNAARALGRLLNGAERARLADELGATAALRAFRFPFGWGLIEAGCDDGVEYLAFKYDANYHGKTDSSSVLYLCNERVNILAGFSSPKLAGFYRQALAYAPLRAVLTDPTKSPPEHRKYVTETCARLLQAIAAAGLRDTCAADLKAIGSTTELPEIKKLCAAWLTAPH